LDDLFDKVSKIDGQFKDISNDIQAAFASGVVTVNHWVKQINNNIIYYTAAVLDPCVKLTLIRKQYSNGAPEIIKRIKDYLKREYQTAPPDVSTSREAKLPRGVSAH
jgi:hypothetical protein